MKKKENIKNYYKKKWFEKQQKIRDDSYFKDKEDYTGNWDKAFHNCWKRSPNFKGYIHEFKKRMESLFTDGMAWENYPEWEVDHIIPLAKGGSHSVDNLQPLWMKDNRSKKDRILEQ